MNPENVDRVAREPPPSPPAQRSELSETVSVPQSTAADAPQPGAPEKAGPDLTAETLVQALEAIQGLDFGIGTRISFGPSEHQASHKVWAVTLDEHNQFRNLELD